MTEDEWLTIVQDFMAARINDAPNEACQTLAEAMLQEITDIINASFLGEPDALEDEEAGKTDGGSRT